MLALVLGVLVTAQVGVVRANTSEVNNHTLASRACQGAYASLPFCNPALPLDARVEVRFGSDDSSSSTTHPLPRPTPCRT